MNTFSSVRRGIASSVTLPRRLSLRRSFDEPASSLVKRIEREHKTSFVDAEEGNGYDESTPSSPQGGPILERLEDLLEETAIYAVGDDQKAATWKPPSLQLALEERKRALWRGGVESLATPLRAMGEMGIGERRRYHSYRHHSHAPQASSSTSSSCAKWPSYSP